MKIVITGSSGFVGSALVPALRADGHEVVRLVRRPARSVDEIQWDPARRRLDSAALAGVQAVVHLAGANIGGHPWTKSYKRKLLDSRVDGTTTISQALGELEPRPRVLLSASGVNGYGDAGSDPVDESAPYGSGFLADVVRQWEQATQAAQDAGIRTVHMRNGVILSRRGGALQRLRPLFKAGLGGRLGSGRQYVSWISQPDHIAAIRFLLATEELIGPVNLTAPQPVTNAEYTKAIARAVHRPAPWVAPAFALRLALDGLASELLLAGQQVVPRKLEQAGFRWQHPDLDTALAAVA